MFTLGISVLIGDRILEKEDESDEDEDEESTSSFQAPNGFTAEQKACQIEALKLHNQDCHYELHCETIICRSTDSFQFFY